MNLEPTLGDILAAALTSRALPSPEQIAQRAEDRLYVDAQLVSAHALARDIAPRLGLTESEAWASICTVPDNLLHLLLSPQGWTAVAGMVALDNGLADPGLTFSIN